VALIGGLALSGGGFDVSGRHIAGLAVWLIVVGLLVLGAASGARLGRPIQWSVGLLGGLALLSALSSFWSGSMELSVIEADRVLAYLSFFLAAFLIAQTDERRQRFAEGLAIAVALVALLGLTSRLLPHVLEVANGLGSGPRLRYPLGYWNANGAMCGMGVALLLWTSRQATWAALRWASVAALPAVLLTLYFTYSRGGTLALAVAAACLLALSRDRLWLFGTLAIGAIGALPAVLAVQARRGLAENIDSAATVDQGVTVLAILVAGTALALALFAGLRMLERRGGGLTGRAVELSRNPALLRGLALAGAVLAIGATIAVAGRAWDQFSSPDLVNLAQPEDRFETLSGAGRHDFYRVALDSFEEKPLLGIGTGTYEFAWERERSIDQPLIDAHSLYLEPLAELGIVGALLVLALVGGLLWWGFGAWRAAPHPERERNAALLAAMAAFAVGAGIDWFWEIAAVGAVFFLAAGVLVSVRCEQIAAGGGAEAPAARPEGQGYGLAIAGLALAWVAALALVGPLLVDRELKSSQREAREGDLPSAIEHARNARSIEPWAASPYEQLGLIALQLQGDYPAAIDYFDDAIEREDQNWQLYELRSEAKAAAGDDAAAQADLERARELNPREPKLQGAAG